MKKFIGRLDIAKGGISELEDMSVETSKLKCKEKRIRKMEQNIKNCGTITKCVTHVIEIPEGKEREKGTE